MVKGNAVNYSWANLIYRNTMLFIGMTHRTRLVYCYTIVNVSPSKYFATWVERIMLKFASAIEFPMNSTGRLPKSVLLRVWATPGRNCTAGNDRIWDFFRWNHGSRIPQAVPATSPSLFLPLPLAGWDYGIRMLFPACFPRAVSTVLVDSRIPPRKLRFPQPLARCVPDVSFSTDDLPDPSASLTGYVILIHSFRDRITVWQIMRSLWSTQDGYIYLRDISLV